MVFGRAARSTHNGGCWWMASRQQMDLADQCGLKVIYSIKDWYFGLRYCPPDIRSVADEEPKIRERVRAFRDHPALLAWYLNDELPPLVG